MAENQDKVAGNVPCRLKEFHELTLDEKVQWLHETLNYTNRRLRELQRLEQIVRQHQHQANGVVVVPVDCALDLPNFLR